MAGEKNGLALGVRGGPLTARVSRTSDEPSGNRRCRMVETHLHEVLFHCLNEMIRHIWDEQILPNRQANFS